VLSILNGVGRFSVQFSGALYFLKSTYFVLLLGQYRVKSTKKLDQKILDRELKGIGVSDCDRIAIGKWVNKFQHGYRAEVILL